MVIIYHEPYELHHKARVLGLGPGERPDDDTAYHVERRLATFMGQQANTDGAGVGPIHLHWEYGDDGTATCFGFLEGFKPPDRRFIGDARKMADERFIELYCKD